MTTAEINKQLRAREAELEALERDFDKEPEIIALRKQAYDVRQKVLKQRAPAIAIAKESIAKLKSELDAKQKKNQAAASEIESRLTPKMRECLKPCGVEGSGNWNIVWVSDNQRYCLVRHPGGPYWNGVGQPRAYAPTAFFLFDMETNPQNFSNITGRSKAMAKFEGRLTADVMRQIKELTK